ncbi:MAG: type II toxin-antitoxin system RelE/ParE family toxin [Calditrichaceae bacterium]|nr:type II toxin-antitoxin system RelE/ParE family toxin [Calditrichia bacterium]NUQ43383.1 type II toxin-antitoxin system RelE/ParE family toxin [Calditrichaceae bacterium]
MAYQIFLKKSAEKELAVLPDKIHDRIVAGIISLAGDPRPKKAKKLQGREGYRIRIGDYRILYMVYDKEQKVEVFSIAHRRDVYR